MKTAGMTAEQVRSIFDLLHDLERRLDEGGSIAPESDEHRQVEAMVSNLNLFMVENKLHLDDDEKPKFAQPDQRFLPATFLVTLKMTVFVDKEAPHEAHPAYWNWPQVLRGAEMLHDEGGDVFEIEAIPPYTPHWG